MTVTFSICTINKSLAGWKSLLGQQSGIMLDIYQTATDEDLVKPKKWCSKVSLTSDIFSIYSQSLANDDVLL